MNNQQAAKIIQDFQEQQRRRKLVQMLADGLASKLNIPPHESGLVWLLGRGEGGSNLEALRLWVDGELQGKSLPDLPFQTVLVDLACELEMQLQTEIIQ